MRSTIHLVSPRDYWPFAVAVREATARVVAARHRAARPTAPRWPRRRAALRGALADGPLRAARRSRTLARQAAPRAASACGSTSSARRRPGRGSAAGPTCSRRPRTGSSRRRRRRGRAAAGAEHLVRRYLAASARRRAPTSPTGRGSGRRDRAGARRASTLRRFAGEDGDELVDLPRGRCPTRDTPAPVRFLPTWDATLLVHARRALILPEAPPAADLPHEDAAVGRRRSSSTARSPAPGGYEDGRDRRSSRSTASTAPTAVRCDEEAERLAAFHA